MEHCSRLPPAISTQWGRLCHGACVASGNAADSPHFVTMVKEQITNTGVIPSMASADDGYSTGAGARGSHGPWTQSGKYQRSQRQETHPGAAMEEQALPTGAGRAQRNGVTGLHFERGL